MVYTDFGNIVAPEDNGKQNLHEFYQKYQKHNACSFGYKLVCVDDKLSKPFKSYIGEDAVGNLFNSMVEERRRCSGAMKNHFNKQLSMINKDVAYFENSTKY